MPGGAIGLARYTIDQRVAEHSFAVDLRPTFRERRVVVSLGRWAANEPDGRQRNPYSTMSLLRLSMNPTTSRCSASATLNFASVAAA